MSEDMENREIAEGRARIYLLLSRVFLKEASLDFLRSLKNEVFLNSLKEMGVDLGDILSEMEEDELIEKLAEEYTQLFVAPQGVSPYESVWLKGLLFQEPASKALAFYKRSGFSLPEDFKGFPDQIGVELSFMGHLAQEESRAWREGKKELAQAYGELQKEFLKKHLSKWAFKFCDSVVQYTFQPFYREMARLTHSFLESEMEDFDLKPHMEGQKL